MREDDNFFQLGGTSLDLLRVVQLAESRYSITVELMDLYADPTPRALAAIAGRVVDRRHRATQHPVNRLSPQQHHRIRRMRAAGGYSPQTISFSVCFALGARPPVALVRDLLRTLEKRHPALRLSVVEASDQFTLRDNPAGWMPITIYSPESSALQIARSEADSLTDLEGPLWRIGVMSDADDRCEAVVVVAEHIVCDGASVAILAREVSLVASYAPDPIHASDEVAQPDGYFELIEDSERRRADPELGAYWKRRLAGLGPLPHLGELEVRVDGPASSISSADVEIAGDQLNLDELARATGVSLFTCLLAAVAFSWMDAFGVAEVVIHAPVDRRRDHTSSGTVGWFTSSIPFRLSRDREGAEKQGGQLADWHARIGADLRHCDLTIREIEMLFDDESVVDSRHVPRIFLDWQDLRQPQDLEATTRFLAVDEAPSGGPQPGVSIYAEHHGSTLRVSFEGDPKYRVDYLANAFTDNLRRMMTAGGDR